jgi:XTP/dITP diphosphohydrolase
MQTILLATRNQKKLKELQSLLGPGTPVCRFVTIDEVGAGLPEVDEDGDTFVANARKKAQVLAAASGLWTLADDSGLSVDALGGAPGVRSARFAGEPCNDAANNTRLLEVLRGVEDRRAQFHCVIALAAPEGRCETVAGSCCGRLLEAQSGGAGFGYDPLFVPDGFSETFAELGDDIKHTVSHRSNALRAAKERWIHDGIFRFTN